MSNIATTIEQSQHLLELGLDPKIADMVWMSNKWLYSIKDNILNKYDFNEQDTLAWSLSALLEVMPSEESKWCTLMHAQDFYWCTFEKSDGTILKEFCSNNYIDAAYEMVCWLVEQGLIKKGDNDED